jgi:hypothetical protein
VVQFQKAALSPSRLSAQDRSVAAQATQIEAEAWAELTNKINEETSEEGENQLSAFVSQYSGIADSPTTPPETGSRINLNV